MDLRRAQERANSFSLGFIVTACMTFFFMGHVLLGLAATFSNALIELFVM